MNEEGIKHLERLFSLHDVVVEELSEKEGPTDVEELKTTFKKFLVIVAASFLVKEIESICDDAKLGTGAKPLQTFVLLFVTEEEEEDAKLAEAASAYFELREARNEYAHEQPGAGNKKFGNWTVEDVKGKYERALAFVPMFERLAKKFANKQREKIKQSSPPAP